LWTWELVRNVQHSTMIASHDRDRTNGGSCRASVSMLAGQPATLTASAVHARTTLACLPPPATG
jgi:hypothetical protein